MGCFLACFGSSKDENRRNRTIQLQRDVSYTPVSTTVPIEQKPTQKPLDEIRFESNEPVKASTKKKVTFDANVTTFGDESAHGVDTDLPSAPADEPEKAKEQHNTSEILHPHVAPCSFPPNHRYYNCRGDEVEDLEFEEAILDGYDDDDDDDDESEDGHEGYGGGDCAISSSEMIIDHTHVSKMSPCGGNSVLNPVENVVQWKALKSKGRHSIDSQKENSLGSVELKKKSEVCSNELSVNASLSSWLVPSGVIALSPNCSVDSKAIENSPISSSPERSPRSKDKQNIVVVGGHKVSHTTDHIDLDSFKGIPNTNSRYREDRVVSWHSTPFETRLERALKKDVATTLPE